MSEYQFVERPLLTQLESMGWRVIDQSAGIPQDPNVCGVGPNASKLSSKVL